MTIHPVKFTVKHPVVVDEHEIANGIYVGQMISDTEIERQKNRACSYFLHLAAPRAGKGVGAMKRFDLDVTDFVAKGQIAVS